MTALLALWRAVASPASRRAASAAFLLLALAGCASVDPYRRAPMAEHLGRSDRVGECARLFQHADRAIEAAGVRDAMAPRVAGFPYLRVDRFSADLGTQLHSEAQRDAWRDRLNDLDRQARTLELRNARAGGKRADAFDALEDCRATLQATDRAALAALVPAARVPDDYSTGLRALGVYPLTKLAFSTAIRGWQARTVAEFARPLDDEPQLGTLQRYAPEPPVTLDTGGALAIGSRDPLGVPLLSAAQLERLVARHAPLYEIDTVDDNDRIGALTWTRRGAGKAAHVGIDVAAPAAYVRVAHTRLGGQVLVQLVYTVWFAARPREGSFDLLAGPLDGLIWRVTLGPDLEPLVYDTIHPCGCYHMFFPTARVRVRAGPIEGEGRFDESLLAPQMAGVPTAGERVLLRLAARTHYVRRVLVVADPDAAKGGEPGGAGSSFIFHSGREVPTLRYTLRDEDLLRALPLAPLARAVFDATSDVPTRSVYGEDGLIAGSERLERFFFWPMGIASAGQMRQWGRHATAFVGRRHFDDPRLLERYFVIRDQ